jgi:hypothetical protein
MLRRVVLSKSAIMSAEFAASVLMVEETFLFTVKTQAAGSLERIRNFYPTARRHIREEGSTFVCCQDCPGLQNNDVQK